MNRKIFAIITALIFGANVASAEESGVFFGLGAGYGDLKLESKASANGVSTKTEAKGGGVVYGAVLGYKQFFNPYVGLRYYVSADATHSKIKYKGQNIGREMIFVNYFANVDLLVNFIGGKEGDLGVFVGLGLGGNTLTGKGGKDVIDGLKAREYKPDSTSIGGVFNIGLRTNITKTHGLEFIAKVPVVPLILTDMTRTYPTGDTTATKVSIGPTYQLLVRYIASF